MNLIKALLNSTPQYYHYPNEEMEAWLSNITEGLYSFEVSKAEDRFADGNTMYFSFWYPQFQERAEALLSFLCRGSM